MALDDDTFREPDRFHRRAFGAVGAFAAGIVVRGEAAGVLRTSAALLIVAGLAPMKLSSPG